MTTKAQWTWTTLALTLAISGICPAEALAQEANVAVEQPGAVEAVATPARDAVPADEATHAAQALRPTEANTVLLRAPVTAAPEEDGTPAATVPVAAGGGTGLGFMIAGGAALIAGLIIGGTAGNVIAVGGAVLGVYGIIVYF